MSDDDGLLVDSERVLAEAIIEVIAEWGADVSFTPADSGRFPAGARRVTAPLEVSL